MFTCGIDIGSRSIECAIYNGTDIISAETTDTGATPTENAEALFQESLNAIGITAEMVEHTTATGYGRNYYPKADSISSEILCHAAGVHFYHPDARTVIDIGGQDSKMMQLDSNGKVQNFVMNDRCAAGTGKFIEMVAKTVVVDLHKCGEMALSTDSASDISSMCAVFAESEIIGLLHKGTPVETILKGVFKSVAKRIMGMAGKIPVVEKIIFTGGVALNQGVVKAIETECGSIIHIPQSPQFTGAVGAAISAFKKAN